MAQSQETKMVATSFRSAARVVAVSAFAVSMIASAVQAQAAAMDPAASKILERMTSYLGSLQSFSVDTENMLEDVLVSGQKIQYDFNTRVTIQRPNKLRAERAGDLLDQVVVYDGKTLTIYNRQENVYAVAEAPSTLDELIHFARDNLGFVPPASDLVFTNAFDLLTAHVKSGAVVGKSMVRGVKCDHLAFRSVGVDWQIWIADGGQPLPQKYVVTTLDDSAQPQYILLMSNWNVAPKPSDSLFRFTAPKGATKIDFIPIDNVSTSGR
jgi:hypothetical protein